jgi:hypothetical protein
LPWRLPFVKTRIMIFNCLVKLPMNLFVLIVLLYVLERQQPLDLRLPRIGDCRCVASCIDALLNVIEELRMY